MDRSFLIALSSAIAVVIVISSVVVTAAVNTPVRVTVVRTFESTGSVNVPTVDPQTIAKYPSLQSEVQEADRKFEKYLNFCNRYNCGLLSGGIIPDVGPVTFELPNNVAREMVNDSNMKFQLTSVPNTDVKLHTSNIKLDGKPYMITVSGLQD